MLSIQPLPEKLPSEVGQRRLSCYQYWYST